MYTKWQIKLFEKKVKNLKKKIIIIGKFMMLLHDTTFYLKTSFKLLYNNNNSL